MLISKQVAHRNILTGYFCCKSVWVFPEINVRNNGFFAYFCQIVTYIGEL